MTSSLRRRWSETWVNVKKRKVEGGSDDERLTERKREKYWKEEKRNEQPAASRLPTTRDGLVSAVIR